METIETKGEPPQHREEIFRDFLDLDEVRAVLFHIING